jgi:hypothetical protein
MVQGEDMPDSAMTEKTKATQTMVERAKRRPGVAEALRVFELASARSPQVVPLPMMTRFSTGTNS